jgi:hypothetical protein
MLTEISIQHFVAKDIYNYCTDLNSPNENNTSHPYIRIQRYQITGLMQALMVLHRNEN